MRDLRLKEEEKVSLLVLFNYMISHDQTVQKFWKKLVDMTPTSEEEVGKLIKSLGLKLTTERLSEVVEDTENLEHLKSECFFLGAFKSFPEKSLEKVLETKSPAVYIFNDGDDQSSSSIEVGMGFEHEPEIEEAGHEIGHELVEVSADMEAMVLMVF